jgi:hypothetical protein
MFAKPNEADFFKYFHFTVWKVGRAKSYQANSPDELQPTNMTYTLSI